VCEEKSKKKLTLKERKEYIRWKKDKREKEWKVCSRWKRSLLSDNLSSSGSLYRTLL
jgi:hypothetical protein